MKGGSCPGATNAVQLVNGVLDEDALPRSPAPPLPLGSRDEKA